MRNACAQSLALMRNRTQRVLWAASLALTYSCATSQAPGRKPTAANTELTSLQARQGEQDHRIAELEARIALLEADARQDRSGSDGPVRSGESVRIGGEHASTMTSGAAAAEPLAREDAARELDDARMAKRPKLRLYGKGEGGRGSAEAGSAALPLVPVVSETLPVAPLPEQRAAGLRSPTAAASPAAEGGSGEAGLARYRAALRLLRERHFAEAAQAFGTFIEEQPSHELVASAFYWRGEAHYARRDYVAARAEFEALLARFPRADKASDALLKLALCYRQLGAQDKAKDALRRLRADYPNSQAASTAAREGST